MATITAATKNSLSPTSSANTSSEPTRISATRAVTTVAAASTPSDVLKAPGPERLVARDVHPAVPLEGDVGHDEVDEQQRDRDRHREIDDQVAVRVAVPRGHGGNEEEKDRQGDRAERHEARPAIDLAARPCEEREAEDEQKVADHRAGERAAHDLGQPFVHGEERDDQLRGVAERRVEEASDAGSRVLRSVLGRLADQPREGDQRDGGQHELDRLVEVCQVVERDRERPDQKTGEEDAAHHGCQPYPRRARRRHVSAMPVPARALPVSGVRVKSCADPLRKGHHPGMSDIAPVTVAPAEIPLRPQDEVECRRCEVHCDRVVYPAACIARGCPFVYAYEAWGHTYMGCMQKVFDVEIDVDLLGELEAGREGFGAVKARRTPLPMCHAEISSCYEHRVDEVGCRNPEFFELPLASPSFRVFAVVE